MFELADAIKKDQFNYDENYLICRNQCLTTIHCGNIKNINEILRQTCAFEFLRPRQAVLISTSINIHID